MFATKTPVVVAVNKIDRLSPAAIGASIERIAELGDFRALVPISAKRRDGIDRIGDELLAHAPEGPALYPVERHAPATRCGCASASWCARRR